MATAEVAAALLPENEQTMEELIGETATGAATEAKEVVQVEDDDEEEEWNVAPEETGRPEDSGVGKDEEEKEAGAGTWDDEDDDDDKENREGDQIK